MSDPFELLGIDHHADELTIRRAYAQHLRATRPDDDPAGFQSLNEAYRAALARAKAPQHRPTGSNIDRIVQSHTGQATDAADVYATSSARSIPMDTPFAGQPDWAHAEPSGSQNAAPALDSAAFVSAFRLQCVQGGGTDLPRWLAQNPALWNLAAKQATGERLLQALHDRPEPMSVDCFNAVAAFFHFDDALGNIDPLVLRRVSAQATAAWLLRPENRPQLAQRVYGSVTGPNLRRLSMAIRQVSRPFRWWRDLPQTLRPRGYTRHVAEVLAAVSAGDPENLPDPISPAHARFWMDAATPTASRVRFLVLAFRSVALPIIVAALVGVATAAVALATGKSDWLAVSRSAAWVAFIPVAVCAAFFWLILGGVWVHDGWAALTTAPGWLRTLSMAIVPAACALAMFEAVARHTFIGTGIAIAAMLFAFWRSGVAHPKHRHGLFDDYGWFPFLGIFILAFSVLYVVDSAAKGLWRLLPVSIFSAIAMAAWGRDWYRRGFVRPRSTQR